MATTQDILLTEIERQQKYLDELPVDYQFPLFNSAVAIESQRKTGYKTTASAAREIVDNAIEAGADDIRVIFHQGRGRGGPNQVLGIAFIDNGSGMIPKMAQFALSWGGGTHSKEPEFIGKFGFGLPNASINRTRLVELYTRTSREEVITKAWLDLDSVQSQFGTVNIPDPVDGQLPDWVGKYMENEGLPFDHGTVVVWVSPDRVEPRRPTNLKEHLVDDFGVVYRYLLADTSKQGGFGLNLMVEGLKVEPVDPLFLEAAGRYFEPPVDDHEAWTGGGARKVGEWFLAVAYMEDEKSGERILITVDDIGQINFEDPHLLAAGTIHVRMARFPVEFAEDKGRKAVDTTDAHRRHDVRKQRRGMSFVRAGREIETVDVFPKLSRDFSQGLGDWPRLQGYAYHWGIELRFEPVLDEVFNIGNDKQSVRPMDDLWRVLAGAKIDAAAMRENRWQTTTRKLLADARKAKKKEEEEEQGKVSLAAQAAQDADTAAANRPNIPEGHKHDARTNQDEEIRRRMDRNKASREDVEKGLAEEARQSRYRIDYYDGPDGPFYEPRWEGGVVVVRINRQHSFYKSLYQGILRDEEGGYVAEQAINVILIALARAELDCGDTEMEMWYQSQRRNRWSTFLDDAMRSFARRLDQATNFLEEEEEPVEQEGQSEGAVA